MIRTLKSRRKRERSLFVEAMLSVRPLFVLATLLAVSACDSPTLAPVQPSTDARAGNFSIACQLGCVDIDPNPAAAGVFLGNEITATYCWDDLSSGDVDADGLSDYCEKLVAQAFAPELYFSPGDAMGREPRWAARLKSGNAIRVAYLPSYYRDAGSGSFGCTLPGHPSSCNGHNGDSEILAMDVRYVSSTHHWVLDSLVLSHHGALETYPAIGWYSDVEVGSIKTEYPDHAQSYPRVYVSEGKHANFLTESECESGGFGGADTCDDGDSSVRLEAYGNKNIGSRSAHTSAQDCVSSENPSYPYYGLGRAECYWTVKDFRGWVPDSAGGTSADDYSTFLASLGF